MTEPWLASGVIAVVRLRKSAGLGGVATALSAGGVTAGEVTLTTPGALEAIAELASQGTGSGLGGRTGLHRKASRHLRAPWARFVVSPPPDLRVLRHRRRHRLALLLPAVSP